MELSTGTVRRVNGPLVEVDGLTGVAMLDVVHLGPERIAAEVVGLAGERATLQAYEYTGGLRPGHRAEATGDRLSGLFGPGLLGQAFDGLLRPLSGAPVWLTPEPRTSARGTAGGRSSRASRWATRSAPGDVLGVVPEAGPVEHRVRRRRRGSAGR